MKQRLLAAAFAMHRVLPAGVKRAVRRVGVGGSVREAMRRNSVDAHPAYAAAELRAAILAGVARERVALDVRVLAARNPADDGAPLFDGTAVDDLGFINAVNMLHVRGAARVALLPSDQVVATSKQAWVPLVTDSDVQTRVIVHNYFGKNYAIDDVLAVLFFAQVPGRLTFLEGRLLAPDQTVGLEISALPDGQLAPVTAGASLVAVALHPALGRVGTKEFRYAVALEGPRSSGVVHSLPAVRFEVPQPVSTGTKAYATPVTERLHVVKSAGDPGAELRWDGRDFSAAPGAGTVARVGGGGAPGWGGAAFTFSTSMRTAQGFYVGRNTRGEFFLHHDQGAHARPSHQLVPSAAFLETRQLAAACSPLFHDRDVDLGLAIDARNSVNTYRAVELTVCDDTGKEHARERVEIASPLAFIDVGPLRRRAGLDPSTCGYVQLSACAEGAEVHDLVDNMIVFGFYRAGARLLDTVEAGTSMYADFQPIVHDGFTDRRRLAARAKKFAPFVSSPRWRPWLWTINVGYARENGPVDLTLTLRRPGDGRARRHHLAPGEARLWNLDEEFGLNPADGRTVHDAVWLESTNANLFAIYMYEDRNDPQCFGLDHLTGG